MSRLITGFVSVALTPVGPRLRPDLVVGVDVRVLDARAGDAGARRQLARADLTPGGRATDPLRGRARRAVGISESGYNARDLMQAYQYSGFGVPGLGLKRGLSEDVVVAVRDGFAAMIDPEAAVQNFRHLSAQGAAGHFGFREALDYTPRGSQPERRFRWSRATWRTIRG